jgi:two-component system, chemotaxis family, chemotaxis protein CheY
MRPSLLTVDDAKAVRLLVEKVLSPYDCEVNEASNGYNAFFAIERHRPDLILLDVSMPVMDGMETLRRLKGAAELADIPVIMMTSPADRPLLPEISALGAGDTIMKPFDPATLLASIGRLLAIKPVTKAK